MTAGVRHLTIAVLVATLAAAPATAARQAGDPLATVTITAAVLADGRPLPPGRYDVRLTGERLAPRPGQSLDAERRVEFVANGTVMGHDVAIVLRDDDLPAEGASAAPVRDGTRVDLLRGGEFLRISIKRAGERFLIYLPVAG